MYTWGPNFQQDVFSKYIPIIRKSWHLFTQWKINNWCKTQSSGIQLIYTINVTNIQCTVFTRTVHVNAETDCIMSPYRLICYLHGSLPVSLEPRTWTRGILIICGTLTSISGNLGLQPLKTWTPMSGPKSHCDFDSKLKLWLCVRKNDFRVNLNSSNKRCTIAYKQKFQGVPRV